MVWRVSGETATILGGERALLMQIAHPMVAAGVADHSDFETNAFARLWRTLGTVHDVVFGDIEQAEAAAGRVAFMHSRVAGTRDDRTYRATEPELLLWVHATLVDTGLVTYERFVGSLTLREREAYYLEMRRFGTTFGVPERLLPPDLAAFHRYLGSTLAEIEVTREARRLAQEILRPPVPLALTPIRALLAEITTGLLPERLRAQFGLAWSPGHERSLRAAAWTVRRTLPVLPAKVRRWPHALAAEGRLAPGGGTSCGLWFLGEEVPLHTHGRAGSIAARGPGWPGLVCPGTSTLLVPKTSKRVRTPSEEASRGE
jgi:uncharacterized protein (DUF2236 family)